MLLTCSEIVPAFLVLYPLKVSVKYDCTNKYILHTKFSEIILNFIT